MHATVFSAVSVTEPEIKRPLFAPRWAALPGLGRWCNIAVSNRYARWRTAPLAGHYWWRVVVILLYDGSASLASRGMLGK